MADYYFTGIGGVGMSALAQILKAQGHNVSGSDRNYDRNLNLNLFNKLENKGIKLFPQDGSGIDARLKNVIVSSAVENDNPDIKMAAEINVPIMTRANLLASLFNKGFGVAVGGTNGKTTVTSMIGWILENAGLEPTIITGGFIRNLATETEPGNARPGSSNVMVIEADESDGSIVAYKPKVSVITNISKDHKTVDELLKLFNIFADNTKEALILNADCHNISRMLFGKKDIITYGTIKEADIFARDVNILAWGSMFKVGNTTFQLNLPGLFNVSNALAAISVARALKVPDHVTAKGLRLFQGVQRRMDIVEVVNNIKIINDYAHNPDKIKAAIEAVRSDKKRLIAIFQPHGYGPTNLMKDELIKVFKTKLLNNDILIMPEIYYAGGTANKNISSKEIIESLRLMGINAFYFADRRGIINSLKEIARPHDTILIMGARDDTLTDFCHEVARMLKGI